ncbi:hypothetical protein NEUTE1DRAFT_139887 [Neurospora tetrasperma FGSC 2508]|uniref:Auxiliary Activity family 9 catalytic domain-containing protein n=1 Tax=Neurospora tetrasperma (strain FGSC 2508 / ATCC MYA-4615 / P0657) TaxID=510951 RepID=F8MUF5_NEUT8|nr:uncharacterized protein NEUTE1DRAFT_139887 [Neurospora tetrasperma FGSC 2508]EGO55637.1 hypothetical protein NEUTE1DRAFT_139887 [Neurospora tetrasperma FGSC 2508]EGZ69118.1 hypothetical protein NEUTE2DRAFT_168758 [Neurospora tetrasperma FGSC 2509]
MLMMDNERRETKDGEKTSRLRGRKTECNFLAAAAAAAAQFYIYVSSAQISVSGDSGSYSPRNLVSFLGAYQAADPGIMIGIYHPVPKSYTPPALAVESY